MQSVAILESLLPNINLDDAALEASAERIRARISFRKPGDKVEPPSSIFTGFEYD